MAPARPAAAAGQRSTSGGACGRAIAIPMAMATSPDAWLTSRTASTRTRRLWRPPRKSPSPQNSDDDRPSATASTEGSWQGRRRGPLGALLLVRVVVAEEEVGVLDVG